MPSRFAISNMCNMYLLIANLEPHNIHLLCRNSILTNPTICVMNGFETSLRLTKQIIHQIYRDESDGSRWSGLGAEPVEDDCGWCGGGALFGGRGGIFTTAPVADQPGTWRHAVKISQDAKTPLTQGGFEITQLVGWDERRRFL